MTVWTTQPRAALTALEETGVFRCEPQKSFNLSKPDSLKKPYRWLTARMQTRIGPPPTGVVYPVWAWHTWEFERRCPDPESAAFLRRTEEKALFTLEIPENELVLTDFDAWQSVMMGSYVSDAATPAAYAALEARLDALSPEETEAEIERSWENVFLTDRVESDVLIRGRYIQATFWELKRAYVRDVRLLPPNA